MPLGQRLVAMGALDPGDLVRALALQTREDARLGTILLAHRMVSPSTLQSALAAQWGAEVVDLDAEPPDTRLIDRIGAPTCLTEGLVPWRRVGGVTVIATARPERFETRRPALESRFGPVAVALTSEAGLARALTRVRGDYLARRAETRPQPRLSCRTLRPPIPPLIVACGATLVVIALGLFAPIGLYLGLLAWATGSLALILGLRLAALTTGLAVRRTAQPAEPAPSIARLPIVSIMVPLFREAEVATRLLVRLERLTYPRELTDVLLVCEEDDTTTAETLARTTLPPWIRVVTVPRGGVQTKPRALNYALDFCKGAIIGVWDAEDAPAPDQLHKVVRRFHTRGPDVACLQGVLDYYNSTANWLSRCFTLEYAAWFRVLLPGMERLGLALPLGGTTIFFRRRALEALGGWDAWNVTEDADLGLRLARAGYVTEMIDTTTQEEANCRALAWVRQRSRWIKGYAVTWAVHMRQPYRLWQDLGPWRFLGVQVLFLCTLSQFLLAPILWSGWLFLLLGDAHPAAGDISSGAMISVLTIFLVSQIVSITTFVLGADAASKRWLIPWIASLGAYFPLASMAAWRGVWELVGRPFYWHKTMHGLHDEDLEALPDPASVVDGQGARALAHLQTARVDKAVTIDAGPRLGADPASIRPGKRARR